MTVKQVIVIRRDLKMRRGKECAQAAHASVAVFDGLFSVSCDYHGSSGVASVELSPEAVEWLRTGTRKVCVQVDSEEELLAVADRAREEGLPFSLIKDEGRTEFKGVPTYTSVAVGPGLSERVDRVTGSLKLY